MPRNQPLSYEGMELTGDAPAPPPKPKRAQPRASDPHATVREDTVRMTLYLNPAGAKAIQRYAVDQSSPGKKVKVHDLLLDALADWCRRHGIQESVRIPSDSKR